MSEIQETVASGGTFTCTVSFGGLGVGSARILQDHERMVIRGGKGEDVLDYGVDLTVEGGSKRDWSLFRWIMSFLWMFEEFSRRPKYRASSF